MKTRCSTAVIFLSTVWHLSLIEENLGCVVNPSEIVAIVGQKVSLRCNTRQNNEAKGIVSKWRIGNEGPSGILIYQSQSYARNGRVNVEQYVADGYFLLHEHEDLINVAIQINETQLEHGGKYFCICDESTPPFGTVNLAVLDPTLRFFRSEKKPLIPEEPIYLNCSISFNGSTSSASVDLTILNATGELLANRTNLQLMQSITGHHVTYAVIAVRNQEQNFTCEMKVWTKSSDGEKMLYSSSSSLYFNWGQESTIKYDMTSRPPSKSDSTTVVAVLGAVGIFITVLVIFVVMKRRRQYHEGEKANSRRAEVHNCGKPRYVETAEGEREITYAENNGFMVEEDLGQQKRKVDNELVVFDNAVYDATPRYDPSRQYKVEQIYNEVL